VTNQALLKAGLELRPRLDLSPKAEAVESELRAEIERLKARAERAESRTEHLESEVRAEAKSRLELVERVGRAEGKAEQLEADFQAVIDRLTTQGNTQLNTQRPLLQYPPDTQRVGLIERLRGRKRGSQGL